MLQLTAYVLLIFGVFKIAGPDHQHLSPTGWAITVVMLAVGTLIVTAGLLRRTRSVDILLAVNGRGFPWCRTT